MNLQSLGITNEEYTTYVEILKSPPTDLVELSKRTKIKRSTLYNILDSLEEKNLISKPKDSSSSYRYIASSPEELIKHAENNQTKIQKEFEKLKAQVPLLNVFLHTESVTKESEYYAFQNDKSPFFMDEIVSQSKGQMLGLSNHHWFEAFDSDKNKKILPSTYLDTVLRVGDRFAFTGDEKTRDEATQLLKTNPELIGKWEPRWIDKKKFDFDFNINTFDDKVLFTVPGENSLGLTGWTTHYFRNEDIAKAMQRLFQYLWETAEDLNPS